MKNFKSFFIFVFVFSVVLVLAGCEAAASLVTDKTPAELQLPEIVENEASTETQDKKQGKTEKKAKKKNLSPEQQIEKLKGENQKLKERIAKHYAELAEKEKSQETNPELEKKVEKLESQLKKITRERDWLQKAYDSKPIVGGSSQYSTATYVVVGLLAFFLLVRELKRSGLITGLELQLSDEKNKRTRTETARDSFKEHLDAALDKCRLLEKTLVDTKSRLEKQAKSIASLLQISNKFEAAVARLKEEKQTLEAQIAEKNKQIASAKELFNLNVDIMRRQESELKEADIKIQEETLSVSMWKTRFMSALDPHAKEIIETLERRIESLNSIVQKIGKPFVSPIKTVFFAKK